MHDPLSPYLLRQQYLLRLVTGHFILHKSHLHEEALLRDPPCPSSVAAVAPSDLSTFPRTLENSVGHQLGPQQTCSSLLPTGMISEAAPWQGSIHSYSKLIPSQASIKVCYHETYLCFYESWGGYLITACTEHKINWEHQAIILIINLHLPLFHPLPELSLV